MPPAACDRPQLARARCRGRARSRTSPRRSSCRRARIQPRCRSTAARSAVLAGRARRPDGREDPAAGGVELLVASRPPARSANSSTRSPAKQACVWQSTRPGIAQRPRAVELLDVAVERAEVAHPPDRGDRARPRRGRRRPRRRRPRRAPRRGAAPPCPPGWRAGRGRGRAAGSDRLRLLERAARVVHLGEADEQLVEGLALVGVERREELGLQPMDDRARAAPAPACPPA